MISTGASGKVRGSESQVLVLDTGNGPETSIDVSTNAAEDEAEALQRTLKKRVDVLLSR